ncbi:hypothetical protein D9M68_860760 [compost metagenome]
MAGIIPSKDVSSLFRPLRESHSSISLSGISRPVPSVINTGKGKVAENLLVSSAITLIILESLNSISFRSAPRQSSWLIELRSMMHRGYVPWQTASSIS